MKNVYVIKDSLGGFAHEGSLCFTYTNSYPKSKDKEYYYRSCKWADRGSGCKVHAENTVEKLRQLNKLAGFEGLDWEVVFVADTRELDSFLQLSEEEQSKQGKHFYITQQIPKGKKAIHEKAVKQIKKEFAKLGI